jgi:hypothetical protein
MLSLQRPVNPHHRDLDEISRGALQWRVLRGALGEGAEVEVLVVNFGDVAPPTELGFDVAGIPGDPTCRSR